MDVGIKISAKGHDVNEIPDETNKRHFSLLSTVPVLIRSGDYTARPGSNDIRSKVNGGIGNHLWWKEYFSPTAGGYRLMSANSENYTLQYDDQPISLDPSIQKMIIFFEEYS
jgi:hypothetical protein